MSPAGSVATLACPKLSSERYLLPTATIYPSKATLSRRPSSDTQSQSDTNASVGTASNAPSRTPSVSNDHTENGASKASNKLDDSKKTNNERRVSAPPTDDLDVQSIINERRPSKLKCGNSLGMTASVGDQYPPSIHTGSYVYVTEQRSEEVSPISTGNMSDSMMASTSASTSVSTSGSASASASTSASGSANASANASASTSANARANANASTSASGSANASANASASTSASGSASGSGGASGSGDASGSGNRNGIAVVNIPEAVCTTIGSDVRIYVDDIDSMSSDNQCTVSSNEDTLDEDMLDEETLDEESDVSSVTAVHDESGLREE